MIDYSVFEGIDPNTLYRSGGRYLQSLDKLPKRLKDFIHEYPFSSAIAFVCGSKAVTWFSSEMYQRLVGESIDAWSEQPNFPFYEFYMYSEYQAEMDVIGYIGYLYEIDYLKKNGHDMSGYSPRSMNDYLDYYLQGNLSAISYTAEERTKASIQQGYEAHTSVMKMLKEAGQKFSRMLEESCSIYEYLLRRIEEDKL